MCGVSATDASPGDHGADCKSDYAVDGVLKMNRNSKPELVRTWCDSGTARVAEFRLTPGSTGDDHFHSVVDELCVCLEGMLNVSRRGYAVEILEPGKCVEIPAGEVHRISGTKYGICRCLIIQGIGTCDFVVV
jgi:mannose-6-phosphate isomerase-like protein (cupin superfamily)